MSVIIRLQNLPWSANALDIRQFFHGLSIPEGGVHIVGGELGDAFIAFSTDEDARQAINRSNDKIKEIQIKLMLSSRTEMQRVIEAARSKSYAAFMQPAAVPAALPAVVPSIIPAAIPEIKKEDAKDQKVDKRDRRRSRSKSRDRRDRSRERDRRDRRHRDRSRSRSRERRERRRRDRSRSRGRSHSRERDRKSRDFNKRSEERTTNFQRDVKKEPWSNSNSNDSITPQGQNQAPFPRKLEDPRRNPNNPSNGPPGNNFSANNFSNTVGRGSWPPANLPGRASPSLQNRQDNFLNNSNRQPISSGVNSFANKFPRNNFPRNQDSHNRYDDEDDNSNMSPRSSNTCVQLAPFYGGYGDIRRFFHRIFISNKGIKFINDEFGHRTGIVYVQFGHEQGKLDALARSGEVLNGCKVEVSHLDEDEFDEAIDKFLPPRGSPQNDNDDSRSGRGKFRSRNITKYFNNGQDEPEIKDFQCLIVDDLPTYVKEQDILHMFSTHPLFSLILTTKPRGGHIAYVKFSTPEVAKKALEEHSHHVITGKPVSVRPCKDEEFDIISKQHEVDIDKVKVQDIGTDCINLTRLPQKINDRDISDFFSDIGVIPTKIHLLSNHLGFTGEAYCEFMNSEEATQAVKKDKTTLGNNTISVVPISREEMERVLGRTLPTNLPPNAAGPPLAASARQPLPPLIPQLSQNQNQNRPFFNRNFDGGHRGGRFGPRGGGQRPRFGGNMNNLSNMQDSMHPGCTVFMDNVPYKAGTNEILDFFEGYNCTQNVSRRFNSNNTPSAEAKVTFHTPEDAYRAVQERNGQKIWERTIYLKQM